MKIFLITEIKAVKVDVFGWSEGSAANKITDISPSVDKPPIKTCTHLINSTQSQKGMFG